MKQLETFEYKVFYEDTDSSGFTYHTSYLKFSERARSEILNKHLPSAVMDMKENNFFFVVKNLEINFLKPSFLFDTLKVNTFFLGSTFTSLKLKQTILLNRQKLCELLIRLVWINGRSHKPAKLPNNITSRFKSFEIV